MTIRQGFSNYIASLINQQTETIKVLYEYPKDTYMYQVNELKFELKDIFIKILLDIQAKL